MKTLNFQIFKGCHKENGQVLFSLPDERAQGNRFKLQQGRLGFIFAVEDLSMLSEP